MCMVCVASEIAILANITDSVSLNDLQFMLRENKRICNVQNVRQLEAFTTAVLKALVDYKIQLEMETRQN